MGWKGTMRSIQAASRRAAKDAERRHKAALKQQQLDDAAYAVEEWEDYIASLISVHVDLADAIDWKSLANKEKPKTPELQRVHEIPAREKLNTFKAGFFDFLQGGSAKKKEKLGTKLKNAIAQDTADHEKRMNDYRLSVKDWESDVKMAKRLMKWDEKAIGEVLTEMQDMIAEGRIGSHIDFKIGKDKLIALPNVHTDEIIPDYRRKLRASGTLSETKMPKGQLNELYQDYVASVALKIAGDLFHVLPYDEVYVNCMTSMLNKKTGHKEDTPILSVQFIRETFKTLNLEHIDPSDSLDNFNHVMKFRKTTGFQAITPLKE